MQESFTAFKNDNKSDSSSGEFNRQCSPNAFDLEILFSWMYLLGEKDHLEVDISMDIRKAF